jgi:hypothetical protein
VTEQWVAILNQLFAAVPSEQKIAANEFDDAASSDVGGIRVVRLMAHADSASEQLHDTEFG